MGVDVVIIRILHRTSTVTDDRSILCLTLPGPRCEDM